MEALKQPKQDTVPPDPSLMEQMQAALADEQRSAQRASLGAQLLLERKREKARLKRAQDALHTKMQLSLFPVMATSE